MHDDAGTALALSVAAMLPSFYSGALPPLWKLRSTEPAGWQGEDATDALRTATVKAAAFVALAVALTGSRAVLVVGATVVLVEHTSYAHALADTRRTIPAAL